VFKKNPVAGGSRDNVLFAAATPVRATSPETLDRCDAAAISRNELAALDDDLMIGKYSLHYIFTSSWVLHPWVSNNLKMYVYSSDKLLIVSVNLIGFYIYNTTKT
jgi:hypothetical protein